MYPKLSCLTLYGENINEFVNKLSASDIKENCSYIFFLNSQGRYLADCFFIKSLNLFIAPEKILYNLKNYFEIMDIRKKFKVNFNEYYVLYDFSDQESDCCFSDPRGYGYLYLSKLKKNSIENERQYLEFRLKSKLAEFEDFEYEKSLIINYGNISQFISNSKGCYPGQEIVARYGFESAKKTVEVVEILDDTILKVFFENSGKYLVYKKLMNY